MKKRKISLLLCLMCLDADTVTRRGDRARDQEEGPCALPAEPGALVSRARACSRVRVRLAQAAGVTSQAHAHTHTRKQFIALRASNSKKKEFEAKSSK